MSTVVRETTPGTLCQYCSADTQELGMLVAGATGHDNRLLLKPTHQNRLLMFCDRITVCSR